VIFGRHADVFKEELGEGRVAIEDVGALSVDVDQVEGRLGAALGAGCELGLDAAQELLEHGRLEWVEEEEQRGCAWEVEFERVLFENLDGGEALCSRVL
jgi:hypothetical protein